MKMPYQSPEMEIRWFETENVCAVSEEGFIPETDGGKDTLGW